MSESEEVRRHRTPPPPWFAATIGFVVLAFAVVLTIFMPDPSLAFAFVFVGMAAGFWFGVAGERSNARLR